MSNKITDELIQAQSEAFKAASAAAQKTLDGFQKLTALNLQTARASLETTTEQIKALLAAKDVKGVTDLVATFTRPQADKFLAYAKAVYALQSEAGTELLDLVRAQIEKGNHQLLSQIQDLAKNTPAGSDGAVNFVKQSLAVANSAYDQLNTATKGFVDASIAGISSSIPAAAVAAPAPAAPTGKAAKA